MAHEIKLEDVLAGDGATGERRGRGRPPRARAATVSAGANVRTLEQLYHVIFAAPDKLGYGEHWRLSNAEAEMLAKDTDAALAAVPSKYARNIAKGLGTAAPFIALAWTMGTVLISRVEDTQKLLEAQRIRTEAETNGAGQTNGGG